MACIDCCCYCYRYIFYSNYLSKKNWSRRKAKSECMGRIIKNLCWIHRIHLTLTLPIMITTENTIFLLLKQMKMTASRQSRKSWFTLLITQDSNYLQQKLEEFKSATSSQLHVEISKDPLIINKYYYGDSDLLKQVDITRSFNYSLLPFYCHYSYCHYHEK